MSRLTSSFFFSLKNVNEIDWTVWSAAIVIGDFKGFILEKPKYEKSYSKSAHFQNIHYAKIVQWVETQTLIPGTCTIGQREMDVRDERSLQAN